MYAYQASLMVISKIRIAPTVLDNSLMSDWHAVLQISDDELVVLVGNDPSEFRVQISS